MRIIFLLFVLASSHLQSQEVWFESSFQALVEGDECYACHYKDFYFIADYCGAAVLYGNKTILDHRFDVNEDWLHYQDDSGALSDPWYYCNDDIGLLIIYDTINKWAYIRTPKYQLQMYYEMPETFLFRIK